MGRKLAKRFKLRQQNPFPALYSNINKDKHSTVLQCESPLVERTHFQCVGCAGACGCVLESSSASTLEVCKAQQFGYYDMLSTIHY